LADGSTLRVMPAVVSGHIDGCQLQGERMIVRGWIVDRRASQPLDQIMVSVNGRLQELPIDRHARPDVARVMNAPSIAECGFCIALPAHWFAPANTVRFFGTSSAGIVSELDYGRDYRWAHRPPPERILPSF
jgi:hypothetical protein